MYINVWICTLPHRVTVIQKRMSISIRSLKPRDNIYPSIPVWSKTKVIPYLIITTPDFERVSFSQQKKSYSAFPNYLFRICWISREAHMERAHYSLCIPSFNFCRLLGDALVVRHGNVSDGCPVFLAVLQPNEPWEKSWKILRSAPRRNPPTPKKECVPASTASWVSG